MNKQQSYFERFKCEFCHKTSTHYCSYKEFNSYLCDGKDCDYKYRIKARIFVTSINIDQK